VAGTQAQVLTVEMGEFFFEPSSLSVRPGAVTVNLTNVGERRAHTFIVKTLSGSDDLAGTDEIPLGESATLQFTLTQPGTYEVYCGVGNHAERGQTGTLTVRAA
jgi:plastocyanin